MMQKIKFLLFSCLLCAIQTVSAQSDISTTIKSQAEKVVRSVFKAEYDTLIKYTHPNVIKFAGGKEVMLKAIEKQMAEFESQNVTIDKIEIGDEIITKRYENEYHALVPKTIIMTIQGQTLITEGYLFGFSNAEGKDWTFVEADKLKSEAAERIFPNFKTHIELPGKSQTLPFEGELSPQTFEGDEETMEGAKSTTYKGGYAVGYIIGVLSIIVIIIGILVGIFFLIRYLIRRNNEEMAVPEPVTPVIQKNVKISCRECEAENRSDSKYCAFCGYALPR
ncbi:MAG: hypothetical protein ACR2MT_06000 [Aurantibacter sp.]